MVDCGVPPELCLQIQQCWIHSLSIPYHQLKVSLFSAKYLLLICSPQQFSTKDATPWWGVISRNNLCRLLPWPSNLKYHCYLSSKWYIAIPVYLYREPFRHSLLKGILVWPMNQIGKLSGICQFDRVISDMHGCFSNSKTISKAFIWYMV